MRSSLNIAMVSDFVYPNYGGVETHILNISKQLITLNHKIIIITHEYPNYLGEIMHEGIQIFYLKCKFLFRNTTLFSLLTNGPAFKRLFKRYNINLVHGHQSSSPLALEGIFHAQTMKIKTVFTEHSLFSVSSPLNIFLNALVSPIIKKVDLKLTVSKACKKNFSKRLGIPTNEIFVIRNSVDFEIFNPFAKYNRLNFNTENEHENKRNIGEIELSNTGENKQLNNNAHESVLKNNIKNNKNDKKLFTKKPKINLIAITRFEPRKGVCILIKLINLIFHQKNNFIFKIIGTGTLQPFLENHIKLNKMESKIFLLGGMNHKQISLELINSDIFINTSLTEAFNISILEAASCGLLVISTNVGGVREVLPRNMIYLTEVNEKSIYKSIKTAVKSLNENSVFKNFDNLRKYSWEYICKILDGYYEDILFEDNIKYKSSGLVDRIYDSFLWLNGLFLGCI
ncbi:N-acetylglucosaminyl-phosphatidylinositol biosynthetic protein [Cucumispora dikerogammari]|nr:N-acetylglucosaminyl-phosphatidylinositol biosynthetic protein [Cucumispora dikerogammari]